MTVNSFRLTAETGSKISISFVGHGFSRAKILVINYFANLKVRPTHKNMTSGTASAPGKENKKNSDNLCDLVVLNLEIVSL